MANPKTKWEKKKNAGSLTPLFSLPAKKKHRGATNQYGRIMGMTWSQAAAVEKLLSDDSSSESEVSSDSVRSTRSSIWSGGLSWHSDSELEHHNRESGVPNVAAHVDLSQEWMAEATSVFGLVQPLEGETHTASMDHHMLEQLCEDAHDAIEEYRRVMEQKGHCQTRDRRIFVGHVRVLVAGAVKIKMRGFPKAHSTTTPRVAAPTATDALLRASAAAASTRGPPRARANSHSCARATTAHV